MLSILCVTRNELCVQRLLEKMKKDADFIGAEFVKVVDGVDVHSNGSIESVLDEAIAMCKDGWILRLDDDEEMSADLKSWFHSSPVAIPDLFTFPRLNLWVDERHYILNENLYPDLQTRLAKKEQSGGRQVIHAGSPFGVGGIVDKPILHHKFLIRDYNERKAIAERYESIAPGAGMGFYKVYSLPEDCIEIRTGEL
jgi:hypothetical protein